MSRWPETPNYQGDGFFVDGGPIKLSNGEKAAMLFTAALITTIAVLSSGDKKTGTVQDVPFNQKPDYKQLHKVLEQSEIKLVPYQPSGINTPHAR
ncbi:MAG TPA: hypothetical protein VG917_04555 [Patescibacteria group bacterium]|nr:hypothetical protein [Patescibacteria group bacterium]